VPATNAFAARTGWVGIRRLPASRLPVPPGTTPSATSVPTSAAAACIVVPSPPNTVTTSNRSATCLLGQTPGIAGTDGGSQLHLPATSLECLDHGPDGDIFSPRRRGVGNEKHPGHVNSPGTTACPDRPDSAFDSGRDRKC
jgi:hypothetical protein